MTSSRLIPFSILQLPSMDAIRRLRRPGAVQRLIMAAVVAAGLVRADTAERPHPPIPVLDWEARSDWKSVKKAGAVGDGVADDTAAIQSVLDTVGDEYTVYAGDRDTFYFPPGTYRITASLRIGGERRLIGPVFIGHGRDTRLVWDGPEGLPMLIADGLSYARYEGLVFDGQGKAGVGILHPNQFFVTEPRYRHLAFLNMIDAGILVDPKRVQAQAEASYENCYFENCGRGVAFLRWNDYNHVFNGCEFRDNGIGIECDNGSFFILNTHFTGSKTVDVKAHPHHGSSMRRVTSLNSQAVLLFINAAGPMTLQDVHVERDVQYTGADIRLAGAPITIFDCVFTAPKGGTPPIRIERDGQRVILSNNRVVGAAQLIAPAREGLIHEIPAGERGGAIHSARRRFIKDSVRIPGKVFDAKRDFGATGDGKADDTAAIQAAIDAAREHGDNAIAYLPAGAYRVTETLVLTGGGYTVGGQGYGTLLRWGGAEGGTIIKVGDPGNLAIEHLHIATTPDEKNGVDILQTGSSKPSSVVYDGVRVFGCYQKQPFRKGLHFSGLGRNDQVVLNSVQGNLRIVNSGDATILGNFTYEGSIVVEGTATGRSGFLGFSTRLATIVTHALYIRDNHSFIGADFYHEQSDGVLHLTGSPDLPPGRVVFTGSRTHLNHVPTPATTIDNYHGEVFLGGRDFSEYRAPDAPPHLIRQTGQAPVELYVFGSLFYGAKLEFDKQATMRVFMLGNGALADDRFVKYTPADAFDDAALKALSRAFDDLRRLGEMDLKLNHAAIGTDKSNP